MSEAKKLKLDGDVNKDILYPVLSDDLTESTPLLEVYFDSVSNPKNISKVIVEMNTVCSVLELAHLKRMRGKDILLFPSEGIEEDKVQTILKNKNFDVDFLEGNIRKTMVAKVPPKVRRQYDVVHKLWPCNFHSNKYLEKLSTNNMFTLKELELHINYMKLAIDVTQYSENNVGTIVVDPKINSVVAVGYSQKTAGPCRHAVMVAIDNVAKTQNGGAWGTKNTIDEDCKIDTRGIPEKFLSNLQENHSHLSFGATKYKGKDELEVPSDGPYLCTGYYLYSTHEPCVMCAMALVHSRIKTVFYGSKSSNGGLGTLCKVHTVKDLNHHYEVFAGLLENECQEQTENL